MTTQTVVTTHSPTVASFYPGTTVLLLQNDEGGLTAHPLLDSQLTTTTPNAIRKLFRENRSDTVTALMHETVLIPEGRSDFEWLRLLVAVTETKEGWDELVSSEAPFGSSIGIIPTHDAAINSTYEHISKLHPKVVVLVDGDQAGDQYIDTLKVFATPPSLIIQWPRSWSIEHVVKYILDAAPGASLAVLAEILSPPPTSLDEVLIKICQRREDGGVKGDMIINESIAGIIADQPQCLRRASVVLTALRGVSQGDYTHSSFDVDSRTTSSVAVRVFRP